MGTKLKLDSWIQPKREILDILKEFCFKEVKLFALSISNLKYFPKYRYGNSIQFFSFELSHHNN